MKRALQLISLLAVALIITLVFRVRTLLVVSHGPVGGTGVIEGVNMNVAARSATRIAKIAVREGSLRELSRFPKGHLHASAPLD